jgi:hypothetical protein
MAGRNDPATAAPTPTDITIKPAQKFFQDRFTLGVAFAF